MVAGHDGVDQRQGALIEDATAPGVAAVASHGGVDQRQGALIADAAADVEVDMAIRNLEVLDLDHPRTDVEDAVVPASPSLDRRDAPQRRGVGRDPHIGRNVQVTRQRVVLAAPADAERIDGAPLQDDDIGGAVPVRVGMPDGRPEAGARQRPECLREQGGSDVHCRRGYTRSFQHRERTDGGEANGNG